MDLIDREELEKSILKWLPSEDYDPEKSGLRFDEDLVVSLMMEIEEQPTVDAEPVRHGKWRWDFGSDDVRTHWYCSECNHAYFEPFTDKFYKYCPNCGAKMSGE